MVGVQSCPLLYAFLADYENNRIIEANSNLYGLRYGMLIQDAYVVLVLELQQWFGFGNILQEEKFNCLSA